VAIVTKKANQEVVVLPSQQPLVESTQALEVARPTHDGLQVRVERSDKSVVELITLDIGNSNSGGLSFAKNPVDRPGAQ
jgi:hypothetical protein